MNLNSTLTTGHSDQEDDDDLNGVESEPGAVATASSTAPDESAHLTTAYERSLETSNNRQQHLRLIDRYSLSPSPPPSTVDIARRLLFETASARTSSNGSNNMNSSQTSTVAFQPTISTSR